MSSDRPNAILGGDEGPSDMNLIQRRREPLWVIGLVIALPLILVLVLLLWRFVLGSI